MNLSIAARPAMEPTDLRTHERVDLALHVIVEHECRLQTGTTRNLSLGGMFLYVEGTVPLGAAVSLRFFLPHQGAPIVATARVRWRDGAHGLGVQFDGLRARDVFALQRLLAPARSAI